MFSFSLARRSRILACSAIEDPARVPARRDEALGPHLAEALVDVLSKSEAGSRRLLHVVRQRAHTRQNRGVVIVLAQARGDPLAFERPRPIPLRFDHHRRAAGKRRRLNERRQHHDGGRHPPPSRKQADTKADDGGEGHRERNHVADAERMAVPERVDRQHCAGGERQDDQRRCGNRLARDRPQQDSECGCAERQRDIAVERGQSVHNGRHAGERPMIEGRFHLIEPASHEPGSDRRAAQAEERDDRGARIDAQGAETGRYTSRREAAPEQHDACQHRLTPP